MYCRAEEFRSVTFFVSTEGKQTGQEEETGYREAMLTGMESSKQPDTREHCCPARELPSRTHLIRISWAGQSVRR